MGHYYGVVRSEAYLEHYGVKGMRWGVRKAIDAKDTKALLKHYRKANKKLNRLMQNADVLHNIDKRKTGGLSLGAGAVAGTAGIAGLAMKPTNPKDKFWAGLSTGEGALVAGLGAYDTITGFSRSRAKGHEKAVKKVNDWQNEMRRTFKGTKYGEAEKNRPDFKDEYTLYEYGALHGKKGQKPIPYRAARMTVKGSDIARDRQTKAKSVFKQSMSSPPISGMITGDPNPYLGVQGPSGRVFNATSVDKMLNVKKKKRS